MTIAQALTAYNITRSMPLKGVDDAVATHIAILNADLARIARAADARRQDILDKATERAPADFYPRLAAWQKDPEADPDFPPILEAVNAIFAPAWQIATSDAADITVPLLSADQLQALFAARSQWPEQIQLPGGPVSPDNLLRLIAQTLCETSTI